MELFLLVALSVIGVRADLVTWEQCKDYSYETRILDALPDLNATDLDLTSCNISEIKPHDFDGLPSLREIRLSDNEIQSVDPVVFITVNGLHSLSLDHNVLSEVPEFGALSLFPNMTKLELHYNQISKLDNPNTFSSMVRLEKLNLEHNIIETLHPDIFKALTNLKSINLMINKITHIPGDMFNINSLESILLLKNRISYVAHDAISSGRLKSLFLGKNKLTHLPQNFVLRLKNASTNFKLIVMRQNPWQCACLLEMMAEAISSRVVSIFDSSRCKFPEADQPSCHRPSLEEALEAPVEYDLFNLNKDVPKKILLKATKISNMGYPYWIQYLI